MQKAELATSMTPQENCSPAVQTDDLDGKRCEQCPADKAHICWDDKWCATQVELKIAAPNGLNLTHPHFTCVSDNGGSCNWNRIGDPSQETFSKNADGSITAQRYVGSKKIHVRACATLENW
jgi:hypothetical protein